MNRTWFYVVRMDDSWGSTPIATVESRHHFRGTADRACEKRGMLHDYTVIGGPGDYCRGPVFNVGDHVRYVRGGEGTDGGYGWEALPRYRR
jgi:hypothetical protein